MAQQRKRSSKKRKGPVRPVKDKALGGRIRELRKASGLTVDKLAVRVDVAATHFYVWEQGKAVPSEASLGRLVKALRPKATAAEREALKRWILTGEGGQEGGV